MSNGYSPPLTPLGRVLGTGDTWTSSERARQWPSEGGAVSLASRAPQSSSGCPEGKHSRDLYFKELEEHYSVSKS